MVDILQSLSTIILAVGFSYFVNQTVELEARLRKLEERTHE